MYSKLLHFCSGVGTEIEKIIFQSDLDREERMANNSNLKQDKKCYSRIRISIGTFNTISNFLQTKKIVLAPHLVWANLDPPAVTFKGWNRSFIGLCWLKVCSNRSTKELSDLGLTGFDWKSSARSRSFQITM